MNGRHGRRRATLTRPRLGLRWLLVAAVYLLATGIIFAAVMLAR